MKATGIVRRIDDLGRVVIPKEIRRTMRIREGDPLEIYTDREGEVIFKKYSPVGELNAFAAQYAETLHKAGELNVIICDRDTVIASGGVPKKDFAEHRLSPELEKLIAARSLYTWTDGAPRLAPVIAGQEGADCGWFISCAMPIISEGDILGAVASLASADPSARPAQSSVSGYTSDREHARGVERKLVQTAAAFLARQLES